MRKIRSGFPVKKNFDNYLLCAYNGDMNKKLIAAYAAGIFDGEGYVGIDKASVSSGSKNQHHTIRIVVSQKDGAIMDWLKINFGGNVYQQRNGTMYSIYRWRIHSKKATEFLEFILPYLVIKKEQAEFAINFMQARKSRYDEVKFGKNGRYTSLSENEINWRLEMKAKLSLMKKEYKPYTQDN